MRIEDLIGECTAYDFKLMLEEKRPKSWLKSVSAFANGLGGSLFFGVADDGCVKGIADVQHICETISGKIRDYMDPLPEVEMIPIMPSLFGQMSFRNVRTRMGQEASVDPVNVGDFVGDVSETKLTERQWKIINFVKESPSMTAKQMSETLSVSQHTVER